MLRVVGLCTWEPTGPLQIPAVGVSATRVPTFHAAWPAKGASAPRRLLSWVCRQSATGKTLSLRANGGTRRAIGSVCGVGCPGKSGGGPVAAARRVLRKPRSVAQLLAQCVAASAQSLRQAPCHIGRSCGCNLAMRPGWALPRRTIRAAWAQQVRVSGGKTRPVRQQAPCSCQQTRHRRPGCAAVRTPLLRLRTRLLRPDAGGCARPMSCFLSAGAE